ncbi:S-adenosyl-L-methionine-dependent methyltransferase [Polychaeton citri CBS 116435]|uniref:Protein-lysine N-methyltransferase EFM4 n=1 Tax=Polychaeton citri CBS 116435 TaxID=1314669 RepID=A0A9P4UMD7_9PEZI|nr:S-adenosyl-L-methionine-dependent methyltransferase [Polychaeton citri CBS 116435]
MAAGSNIHENLDPSELGSKEYWDNVYKRELNNYDADENEGTIWFEESNAEPTVLHQLSSLAEEGVLRRCADDSGRPGSRFLDLGTGNGHMLFSLLEEDDDGERWTGELVGVDYSETSIELAKKIARQRAEENDIGPDQSVHFETWDILKTLPGDWLGEGFDVILDKGTFDAISLMDRTDELPSPCETYREKVVPLMKPGALLVLTSCNWTKEELLGWLAPNDGELEYLTEAKYPTFSFGGHSGQSIVTIVFRKNSV